MAIPILYFGTQLLAAPYFKAETAKGRIPGLSAAVLQNGPPSKALGDGHHGANGALARWLSESVSDGINRLELVIVLIPDEVVDLGLSSLAVEPDTRLLSDWIASFITL